LPYFTAPHSVSQSYTRNFPAYEKPRDPDLLLRSGGCPDLGRSPRDRTPYDSHREAPRRAREERTRIHNLEDGSGSPVQGARRRLPLPGHPPARPRAARPEHIPRCTAELEQTAPEIGEREGCRTPHPEPRRAIFAELPHYAKSQPQALQFQAQSPTGREGVRGMLKLSPNLSSSNTRRGALFFQIRKIRFLPRLRSKKSNFRRALAPPPFSELRSEKSDFLPLWPERAKREQTRAKGGQTRAECRRIEQNAGEYSTLREPQTPHSPDAGNMVGELWKVLYDRRASSGRCYTAYSGPARGGRSRA
jgi:hypothetical protein